MPRFTQSVVVSEEALYQEVSGEIVILDLKSESYFGLDEVGARIWQLLKQHGDLQQIFDIMLDEYYDQRGWDRNGEPNSDTVEKLGLAELVNLQ